MPSAEMKGIAGTDQTGRFPTASARGHKCVFALTDLDTDRIHATPMKSRKAKHLVAAFEEACDVLAQRGFEPILHRIDHETSRDLITAI